MNISLKPHKFTYKFLCVMQIVLFLLTLLSMIGQAYWQGFSSLIIPLIFVYFLLSFSEIYRNLNKHNAVFMLCCGFLIMLSVEFIYSVSLMNNELVLAIRFFAIIFLIVASFFARGKKELLYVFLIVTILYSIFLIGFEIFIFIKNDAVFNAELRHYFRTVGKGDIYSFNAVFYRIQLVGTSVIPVGFFVAHVYLKNGLAKRVFLLLLFLGTTISGNFAYLVALVFFLVAVKVISSKNLNKLLINLIVLLMVGLMALIPAVSYLKETMELKSQSSLPTRFDQVEVLMDDLTESVATTLFGQGLGNTVSVQTAYRDYTEMYYYELQSLYILNQVGIVIFLAFVFLNLLICRYIVNNRYVNLLYLSYIMFACTNPYMFDSFHMLVIILMISLKDEVKRMSAL